MSAEVEMLQTSASAQAFYFDSGDHRLFGWLHRAASTSHPDLGVVICKPFGYEAICAHRGMRAFAEAIQAAGMPALRFDYVGTGDSSEIEPDADQLEAWTQDILAAAEELKLRTGVRHVCLLGFRLGALLASLATLKAGDTSAVVAVSPIPNGRRYLRELRTTRMAASLGLDESEKEADKQGGMEISGFTFSAATLAALAKVDLVAPQAAPLPHMLIIESAHAKAATAGAAQAVPEPERTTRLALPGLVEMLMTPPQFALVPKDVIAATLDWLMKLDGKLPPSVPGRYSERPVGRSGFDALSDELRLKGSAPADAMRTERPVFFGNDASLFGIVTEPSSTEVRRRAVILLNAGADYHIGASRLNVPMARRWALHGYVVLRMDLGGIGDSATRAGCIDDDVFPQKAIDDISAAMELLGRRYHIRDIALAGLCSGAYHALRAAVAGLPVSRILMVNPQNYFWREGETLQGLQLAEVVHNPGVYRERVFSVAAWKRLITGQVNILRIAKIYMQRPLLAAESTLRDVARSLRIRLPNDLGSELEGIVARGVRVVFVFARNEPGIGLLKLQAGNSVKRLAERCRIHVIPCGDHVFTRSGPRAMMEEIVSQELYARPEHLEAQSNGGQTRPLQLVIDNRKVGE
jgi:alpha-beta hydrolase superfamily lysophospholipase